MNDRIKLAKAMGWELILYPNDGPMWRLKNTNWARFKNPPDPFTDANDCEALIAWLNKEGYEVDVLFWPESDATVIVKSNNNLRFFNEDTIMDWKASIARAALKVLDEHAA